MKKRKTNFRIAHGQIEIAAFGIIPPGAIAIIPTNRQDSGAISHQPAGRSRSGVKYPELEGTRRYGPVDARLTEDGKACGFALAFAFRSPFMNKDGEHKVREGRTYLQRHGTAYRLEKLISSGIMDNLQARARKKKVTA